MTDNVNNNISTGVAGSTIGVTGITPGIGATYPQHPQVCPGCGRCHVCGHSTTPPYQVPFMPNYPYLAGQSVSLPNHGVIAINANHDGSDVPHIQH